MTEKKGRVWILTIAALMLILFGFLVWQNARAYYVVDTTKSTTVMLEGEYSIDGGDWQIIDNDQPIDKHFGKAVFRGRLIDDLKVYGIMSISSKNIWYRLYDKYGTELCSYQPVASDIPGYHVDQVDLHELLLQANGSVTLEAEFPYELHTESFSDCFKIMLSESEGVYLRFFFDALPSIIMFLLVCFFGVFFFPIASGLLGRLDLRYVAFGGLCFFAGAYMVVGKFSGFMNLWIMDPSVCMMTDKAASYFFALAVMLYLRSLLKNKVTIIIASSVISVFFCHDGGLRRSANDKNGGYDRHRAPDVSRDDRKRDPASDPVMRRDQGQTRL